MKPTLKFITCPLSFWNCESLSLKAKWVAITVDAYTDSPDGAAMGVKAIQTATNLSAKEVKDALNELYAHGALEVLLVNGVKYIKPLLYKDEYKKAEGAAPVGGTPRYTGENIDYEYVREQWNATCPTCPQVERMTTQRKLKTRTALKRADATVADLIKAFKLVASSSFLRGDKGDWRATYDWLIKSADNLTKVLEGNYHSKDYSERQAYDAVMQGRDAAAQKSTQTDFYR